MAQNAVGAICKGFHHVAIRAMDFDKTVGFYANALGFTEYLAWGEGDGRAVMLDTGDGDFIEIFAGGSEEKPEGSWLHIAFRTDNCDNAIERVKAAGAVITMEPTDIEITTGQGSNTPIRIAFCKGLNSEVIEFFQYR